jgi:hypothetical protein
MGAPLLTQFPNGFAHGLTIRGVPLAMTHPGKVFWVGNSATLLQGERAASNNNKGTFFDPLSTIDAAVGMCAANRGDVIMVRPNHTETVTAAAGLDLDVAGIALIGLGSGSNRPTINFTTATTADMDVDAANITMCNFLFTGGIDALAAPIDVNAADFKLIDCEYRDVTGQATDVILADANADRMLIDGYVHDGAAAAGGASAIALVGCDKVKIRNFWIDGNFSVGAIDIRTTAATNLHIEGPFYIKTRNAADIAIVDTITASTGSIMGPGYIVLQDDAANVTEAITGATFRIAGDNIWVVNADNQKGLLINWTATADA